MVSLRSVCYPPGLLTTCGTRSPGISPGQGAFRAQRRRARARLRPGARPRPPGRGPAPGAGGAAGHGHRGGEECERGPGNPGGLDRAAKTGPRNSSRSSSIFLRLFVSFPCAQKPVGLKGDRTELLTCGASENGRARFEVRGSPASMCKILFSPVGLGTDHWTPSFPRGPGPRDPKPTGPRNPAGFGQKKSGLGSEPMDGRMRIGSNKKKPGCVLCGS